MLGDAAHGAGQQVVVGQLHGMSQRGGSVQCNVLLGGGRSSFLTGGADVVVGFEPLEVVRVLDRLRPDSHVLVNRVAMVPFGLSQRGQSYPDFDDIQAEIAKTSEHITVIDGPALLEGIGVARTLNVLMLGALAGLGVLPFEVDALWTAVAARSPKGFVEANRRALEVGAAIAS